ncbi:helix-turn-helix transcriptional regulator [Murdochiella massiliensis]|uniref:helix-turn-helix transcriptional regulator n=1 Tax=Murdochiella massiliensis TaxID=1673723 RepID=UPI00083558FC|nr:helix-turn-helix transcriptional regulator [Murdochiella massiliensis]
MIREKWMITPQHKETSIAILQENLVALRAKAAISQEELANLIGMSRQTYYGIETGKRKMSWAAYIALIFFFHNFNATKEMVDDLKIYPIELIMKYNDEIYRDEQNKS